MDWLKEHPEVKTIRVAAADLNGVARGKRIPARYAHKVFDEGTKFPYSVLNLDIWGEDVEDSPLVFEIGDPDGLLLPTERGFLRPKRDAATTADSSPPVPVPAGVSNSDDPMSDDRREGAGDGLR